MNREMTSMRVRLAIGVVCAAAIGVVAACKETDSATTEEVPVEPMAPVVAVEQVRSFPHDTSAFTQGLVWHDGRLYESTGRYGQSSLRIVEVETGRVAQRVDLPQQYFAEGLAIVGDSVFQLTWREGVAFVYDAPTLRQLGQVQYKGEGWGLTTDGRRLIVSDGSSYLTFVNPERFQVDTTLRVTDGGRPVDQLNELEWVRGEIWANVWHTNHIVRIDPRTGRVKGRLDLSAILPPTLDPESVPNGIAYDPQGNRLLVTGKLWPRLYEVRIPSLGIGGGGAAQAVAPATAPADSAQ